MSTFFNELLESVQQADEIIRRAHNGKQAQESEPCRSSGLKTHAGNSRIMNTHRADSPNSRSVAAPDQR